MATTATVSSVGDAATTTSLIAANADRTGLIITNTSTAILYILLGTGTASTTNHSWVVAASGGQINLSDFSGRCWKGAVQGIWASDAGGVALITELE
ncbi:hypothetical protein JY97_00640 [Alkalispirochaeta odontotermitis]|nr:hypothetical protein JY97_00640 [Alkalispirochaeta odontotermitis]